MIALQTSRNGLPQKKEQPNLSNNKVYPAMDRIEQLKEETLNQVKLIRDEFETFHDRLKDLRENRIENKIGYRLKQNEAAFLTDQLAPNYNRVEKGAIKPSIDLLIQLSEIFGVTIDFLIKGKYASSLYISKSNSRNGEEGDDDRVVAYKRIVEAKDQQIVALNQQIEALNTLVNTRK